MTEAVQVLADAVHVRLTRRATPAHDPCSAFLALRELLGADEVFLLESLAGPTADRRAAVVGFRPLLEFQVRECAVELHGIPALVDQARAALLISGTVVERDDSLWLPSVDTMWDAARALQNLLVVPEGKADRFSFGFLAFFAYDVVHYIEEVPRSISGTDLPADVSLRVYNGSVVFDLHHGTAEIVVGGSELWEDLSADELGAALSSANPVDPSLPDVPPWLLVSDSTEKEHYITNAAKCLDHITIGDIYQVQIGHELSIRSPVDPLTVYLRLRARNPSPYMALIPHRGFTVVSASPELFVRVEGDEVTMRPIAGTAPRPGDPVEDARRIKELQGDEKERAEHVMLVDLCRNDLGRVARARTVVVDEMVVVENFSHVFHLVSNVRARLADGVDAYDLVRATFPAGTMTGAPKIRAMEIIEETETSRRGFYAGAFGLMDFGGYVNLGLAIRTLFHRGDTWVTRASAGIVADSKPEAEWRETLSKMSAAYWAVTGQELL